jgi:hypothetical protein
MEDGLIKIEAGLICENKSIREIKDAIERDLTYETWKFHYMGVPWAAFHDKDGKIHEEYLKYYTYLRKNLKIYDFFEQYYAKLGQKSLDGIDRYCQIGIFLLSVLGVLLLIISPLIHPIVCGQIIFGSVIILSTVGIFLKFRTLWQSSHLQKEDFEKYMRSSKE